MTIEKIAHDCGVIVLTDSLSAIHTDENLSEWVRRYSGSGRYDLVSLPDMENLDEKSIEVVAKDIATAVSLHRNEKLLVVTQTPKEKISKSIELIHGKLPELVRDHLQIHHYNCDVTENENLFLVQRADTLVISCMDWRLHGSSGGILWKLSEAMGEDATEFDLLATAGGGRELVDGNPRWEMICNRIASYYVKRIVILSHTDCGAYGGNCAFRSDIAQLAELTGGLHDALQTFMRSDLEVDLVTGIVHVDEEKDCVKRVQLFT